jgi:hypothetical protein
MLSNKTGMQQSMASTVMNVVLNYVIQHFMQEGLLGNIVGSGDGGGGLGGLLGGESSTPSPQASSPSSSLNTASLQSALSQLMTSMGSNDSNHPLVQKVKNQTGMKDDNQARQYTQQAIGVIQDHANKDSQAFGSLIGSFLGGGGGSAEERGNKGGIGDVVGSLLGG